MYAKDIVSLTCYFHIYTLNVIMRKKQVLFLKLTGLFYSKIAMSLEFYIDKNRCKDIIETFNDNQM